MTCRSLGHEMRLPPTASPNLANTLCFTADDTRVIKKKKKAFTDMIGSFWGYASVQKISIKKALGSPLSPLMY